jgi:peptide/nickel transport system permease protein
MTAFILKRLGSMVGVLLVLAVTVFALQHLSGADNAHAYLGANASQAAVARENQVLGYDRPLWQQCLSYIDGLFHGSLGTSLGSRRPVVTDLAAFLPATCELALYSLVLAVTLAALLGFASAARWRGVGVLRFVMMVLSSAPPFLLALLGILLFSYYLNVLPAIGRTGLANAPTGPTGLLTIDGLLAGRPDVVADAFRHLLLPAFCVAIGPAVSIGRVFRTGLIHNLGSDHVRTARAKGLRESAVISRHAVRNAISSSLAMTGLQTGLMFSGVVIIETVFSWPGIGLYTDQSIAGSDFPAIAGVTLILGAAYVIINALVDVAQALADPRVEL